MLTPSQKIAILFGALVFVISILWLVARFTAKAESDPFVDNASERHRKMLAEYHALSDQTLDNNGLSATDEVRINELYFELRKVPDLDWRRPR